MTAPSREQKQRLYRTKAWYTLRSRQLKIQPLCALCAEIGITTPATIVDHIKPHRGDTQLFYDPNNLQSLCKHCHDCHKQRFERRGFMKGGDVKGFPIDPDHHWS